MSLSRKFAYSVISILLVIGLLSAFLYYESEMQDEAMRMEALGDRVGPVLEQSLSDYMLRRDSDALDRTLDNLKGIKPISRILLINNKGIIKASSDKKEVERVFSKSDPGCRDCHEKGLRGVFLKSAGMFRWAQPVTNKPECHKCHNPSNRINGVFIIDFSTADLSRLVTKHMYRGLLILLLSLVCISFALIVLSKTFVIERLNDIIGRIRKFKEGDYTDRIPLKWNDEITRLEESFNEMAHAITDREKERDILFKQVSRSYEQWQHTFDSITELISIVDSDGNIVRANRTFMEYFGVTPEDLKSRKYFEVLCGEGAPDGNFSDKAADAFGVEEEIVDKNGRALMVSAFPYEYPEADFRGRILVARDIAERKRLEGEREKLIRELQNSLNKVSHSQRMWQETFDSIGDLISVHDKDFNILKVNRAFAEYFGVDPKEMINRKCYEFFHGETSPIVSCPHVLTLKERRPATAEILDARTRRILRVSTYPFNIPGDVPGVENHGSIHIAKDITEEREKEMRLIMSERLAALGQMASGVAHEINNPLASIAGCAEGLLSRTRKGNMDRELFENYLRIIEEEVSRCKEITTGILSFVRKATYEKREVNLHETLDKAIEIIGFQGRLKEIEVIRRFAEDLPAVYGSEGELRQVFLTIITNALDAMGDRGTLTIETGVEGGRVSIRINDDGPGIPAEYLGKIFAPFFTTKSEKGGTGLGLSISNKIIMNHGGSILVRSEEGKGSTFEVQIPVIRQSTL